MMYDTEQRERPGIGRICAGSTHCLFVAAFADEKGASVLAKPIRDQCEHLLHPTELAWLSQFFGPC